MAAHPHALTSGLHRSTQTLQPGTHSGKGSHFIMVNNNGNEVLSGVGRSSHSGGEALCGRLLRFYSYKTSFQVKP